MPRWPEQTIAERFLAKTEEGPGGCLVWRGTVCADGYGRFTIERRHKLAHRIACEMFVGPIPEGLTIDHLCRVRACVNPAHLEPVTLAENTRRGAPYRKRKTHCPQGHAYTPENTYGSRRKRQCKTCIDGRRRAQSLEQKARYMRVGRRRRKMKAFAVQQHAEGCAFLAAIGVPVVDEPLRVTRIRERGEVAFIVTGRVA